MKGIVWALFVSLVLWGALAWALVGCSTTPPPPDPRNTPLTTIEKALERPLLRDALAALITQEAYGVMRPLHAKTPCTTTFPLPYLVPQATAPKAGEEWRCSMVTTVCPTPPEPDWPMWLILSTREPDVALPIELTALGMPGCWLHVNLDSMVSIPPGLEWPMLSREPGRGRATLRWTPTAGMAGQKLTMQLLVLAIDHFVMSPGLELTVGS
jgi:hypothetical protein